MNIGLHDSDQMGFPNYALMKISRYHKDRGDSVDWYLPLMNYDKVYSSKVFTYTSRDDYLPKDAILGGTGYDTKSALPDEIERCRPDYNLYDIDYSLGFLTRGCIRKCPWCVVPEKEGNIRPYRHIDEIAEHRKVVLMDNNVLASDYGIEQIELIGKRELWIDFNQGLDARLINPDNARMLSKCKWIRYIRLACDTKIAMIPVDRAVGLLRKHGYSREIFCYVLVENVEHALERVEFLRSLKVEPFAQPYRDFNDPNHKPTKEQKRFARWVNHKAVFKTVKWKEYK